MAFFQSGEYEACYTLSKLDNELFVVVAESCIDITIEPLSPHYYPHLVTRRRWQQCIRSLAGFHQHPNMFINPSYDLVLVEVLPGQQPAEGSSAKHSVYVAGNMQDIFKLPCSKNSIDTSNSMHGR